MRNLKTKQSRLDLQNYEFTTLVNKGFSREDFEELVIFKMTDAASTWIKIFKGTSTNPILYKRYQSEQTALNDIANAKASHSRSLAFRKERKENKTISTAANCASAIREELKENFPLVKFSVKSENFSGGDSVRIHWTDGPNTLSVSAIVDKYQYGKFNGMEDLYEYSNTIDGLPQSKYVQTSRSVSDEVTEIVKSELLKLFPEDETHEINRISNRVIYNNSIPVGAVVIGIKESGVNAPTGDSFILEFDLSAVKEEKAQATTPNFEAVEVVAGEVKIVDYSEKAIAVIGDTKPIKEQLKELGGKFNFRLSCGSGWIFPKTKLPEVEALFN